MGAKESKQMKDARKLVESGWPVTRAAQRAGISAPAIYMSAWWKERKAAKK
jgi:hypothetical protein